jgi:hypothetical protein
MLSFNDVSTMADFTIDTPAFDGSQSVYYRILLAVQARLRDLILTGIAEENIIIREVPIGRDMTVPGIVVAAQRPTMSATDGTNLQDDVIYGVVVGIFDNDAQSQANTDKYTKWEEQIAKGFRNQRLTGVAEVMTCNVVPADAISLRDWLNNKFVGALLLQFTARELRGLGA